MIAIIDYGAGNVASVANAVEKLGKEFVITNNEYAICKSEKIIFPGVGEASFAIKQLHLLNIFSFIRMIKKPMLGICLGMQLMCEFSEEGNTSCLGIFPGRNERFDDKLGKVPHMGWNEVKQIKESKLFEGIKDNEFFYFANSYYLPVTENTTSKANHGVDFSATLEKNNFYGVQFHPEKSGDAGLKLFKNFIEL
jgi:imidazole glycerol-phosphate synthase subunit HisH